MEFGFYPTPPPLSTAVKAVWFARGTKVEFDVPEPIVPDGCVEVVLNLADRFVQVDAGHAVQPRDLLVGQMTRPTIASPTGDVDLIGIRFWPGRAGAVLRTPMWELQDRLVAASNVLPNFDRLADDLRSVPRASRLAHLTTVLAPYCARVSPDRLRHVDGALSRIAATHGTESIGALAAATGVTRRHLERQFREQVGLRVKQVARIARIQRVLSVVQSGASLSGAEIAASFGYSDQAHLIHECRALTGTTPGRLVTTERSLSGLMRELPPAPGVSVR
jgi:AraC-like DNA-binding protein